MNPDDPNGWIRTERSSPQTWIMLVVSVAFVLGGVYAFATAGLGVTFGFPTWVIPAAVFLTAIVAIQLYTLNVRRPRAIRLTPTAIEVRTLFGGLVRIPRDSAVVRESWPSQFGNLRSPSLTAWVGLSPNQVSSLSGSMDRVASTVQPMKIETSEQRLSQLGKFFGGSQVPVRDLAQTPGFMRTPLLMPVAVASLFFVPALGLIVAFTLWLNDSRPGYFGPPWAVWFLIAFGVLLVTAVVWLAGVVSTPFGIATSDEGLVVFERTLRRGIALRRTLSWGALKDPEVQRGKQVWVAADVLGVSLTFDQARAVLTDPRCPLRNRVPTEVLRALNMA